MAQEQVPTPNKRKSRPFKPTEDLTSFVVLVDGSGSGSLRARIRKVYVTLAKKQGARQLPRISWPDVVPKLLPGDEADFLIEEAAAEEATVELLAQTDQALEAIAGHADRIDSLLDQIRAVRAETLV